MAGTIQVEGESLEALRSACRARYGRVYGHLGLEASAAVAERARRLLDEGLARR